MMDLCLIFQFVKGRCYGNRTNVAVMKAKWYSACSPDVSTVSFRYYLLGGNTAAPSGLFVRLCHAFLVLVYFTFTVDGSKRGTHTYTHTHVPIKMMASIWKQAGTPPATPIIVRWSICHRPLIPSFASASFTSISITASRYTTFCNSHRATAVMDAWRTVHIPSRNHLRFWTEWRADSGEAGGIIVGEGL